MGDDEPVPSGPEKGVTQMDGYLRGGAFFEKHLYDAAYQEWNDALAHSRDGEDRLRCLRAMGRAQYQMGKFHQANFLWSVAQNWADELPGEFPRLELTIDRLSTLRSMGLFQEGFELAEKAIATFGSSFSGYPEWVHLSGLYATFLLDLGEVDKADRVIGKTLQRGDAKPLFQARLWKLRSQVRLLQDEPEVAASLLEHARTIIVDEGTYRDRVLLFIAQAHAAAAQGQIGDASIHLTETVALGQTDPARFNVVYAARVALLAAPLMRFVDPEAAAEASAWGEANMKAWGRVREAARYRRDWSESSARTEGDVLVRLTQSVLSLVHSRGFKDISPVSGYYSPLVYAPVTQRIGREFTRTEINQACLSGERTDEFSAQGAATVVQTYAEFVHEKGYYREALDELTQGHQVNPKLTMRLLFEHMAL